MGDGVQHLLTIITSGIVTGAFYGIVGLGLSFVFRVTKMLNLAHGGLVMFMGLTYAWLASKGLSPAFAALLTLVVGGILGAGQGLGMRPWLSEERQLVGVFITLAFGLLLEGVALILFGRDAKSAAPVWSMPSWHIGGAVVTGPQVVLLILVAAGSIAFTVFFYRSRSGRMYRAIVDDELGAKSVGLAVGRYRSVAFAVGGVAAAMAACAITPPSSMVYSGGSLMLVNGLTASILGGLANPLGALVGGIVVGLIQTLITGEVSTLLELPASLALLLMMLAVRPEGLFPTRLQVRSI